MFEGNVSGISMKLSYNHAGICNKFKKHILQKNNFPISVIYNYLGQTFNSLRYFCATAG